MPWKRIPPFQKSFTFPIDKSSLYLVVRKIVEIQIKKFERSNKDTWDTLLNISPQATVWHISDWLEILEKYTGWKLHKIGGFLRKECIMAIPIFFKKKFFFRRRIPRSLSFTRGLSRFLPAVQDILPLVHPVP
jgi:hypothetical protein